MNSPRPVRNRAGGVSRRQFVAGAAATGAAWTLVPRHVLGGAGQTAPSEVITLAAIGVGDQGMRDMGSFLDKSQVRVVAVCDVEVKNLTAARNAVNAHYGDKACKTYKDYHELFSQHRDLDATLIVTPDHSHAVIASAALKAGKHVYCQKPFTHTIYEARTLSGLTRETWRATQLGTGPQAGEEPRLLREWVDAGAIGAVREVHLWSNRPFWPQGMERPTDTPPVPPTLDWDLWLGPAPHRPYHPAYLPLVFRGWRDFGTGALGDMGCYAFDIIFRVLRLRGPLAVEASGAGFAAKMWAKPEMNSESWPQASLIRWEFPARGSMPPVSVFWYDGGLRPVRPRHMEPKRPLEDEGMILVGDEGALVCGFCGQKPRLVPAARADAFKPPPKTLPRSIGHHEEWLQACRGGEPAGANFEFAATVTEALLLGNVALRFPGRTLEWNWPALKVNNLPDANKFVHREYRQGWSI
ncbi:MAG: Gfo/Idh/MocA family oxidoreductase [Phycisphaerae bacterium]|nr:Gfo/Idh/MocA family oxidoreductase [Phycisphaerae bacterium]